jgi:hypothetical protein
MTKSEPDGPAFREVTREQFREIYFRLGGGPQSGWTAAYWEALFDEAVRPGWRFMIQEPRAPGDNQMWIVADNDGREYRLFFLSEESTESFFDLPGVRG